MANQFKKGHIPWNKGIKGLVKAWNKLDLDENFIKEEYSKDHNASRISRELGVNYQTIINRLRKMNIAIKNEYVFSEEHKRNISKSKSFKLDEKRVIELYTKEYKNPIEIGKLFSCGDHPIRRILKKNNIQKPIKKIMHAPKIRKEKIIIKTGKMVLCDLCRKEIYVQNYKLKDRKNHFCSRKCQHKFQLGKIPVNRSNKEMENEIVKIYNQGKYGSLRLAKRFNLGKTTIKRILKRNNVKIIKKREFDEEWRRKQSAAKQGIPLEKWEKFVSREPYSQNWDNRFKRAIRKRDNAICMLCGIHKEKLNYTLSVHHINYDKQLTCPENCISLCKKCHILTGTNRDYWPKFFQDKLSKFYGYQYEDGNIILKFQQLNLGENENRK